MTTETKLEPKKKKEEMMMKNNKNIELNVKTNSNNRQQAAPT
jgi:hypothetical protein